MSGMSHKKIKTEPCMSPESPFMRKPSKEFLQRLACNKLKPREGQKKMVKYQESLTVQNISKISFIPCVSRSNLQCIKNEQSKYKKTTIEMQKFKIKHENMVLKTELDELKKINKQLVEENTELKKENQDLRKQFESGSRLSKISIDTHQHTEYDQIKKTNILTSFGSRETLLEIQNYQIMPTTLQLSHVNSIVFDQELEPSEQQYNFLSSSLTKKSSSTLNLNKKSNNTLKFQDNLKIKYSLHFYQQQVQILTNRITYLENQLEKVLLQQKQLEKDNQSLRLSASMSKRKLEVKDSQLKEIKIKQKKKIYSEKLFELSSEEENQLR